MSDAHPPRASASPRNRARRLAFARLARGVQGRWLVLALAAAPACVIPPSLEVGADAATNSPPAILSVTGDQQALAEPGPVVFTQGSTAGTVSVQVIDTDVTDQLWVRIFVDYNSPDRLNARVFCAPLVPPSPAIRTTTCNMTTLCATSDLNTVRNMTIVVFDRQPKDDGTEPAFQAMDPPGLSTSRFYLLKCMPGPS